MTETVGIAGLSAAHFELARLVEGGVRVFAHEGDPAPVTHATVEKVVRRPQSGVPDAPVPAFTAYLLFEPQFAQAEADVWLAGADWGPVGPLRIARILPPGGTGERLRFQLIRN
ncbi:MAG: hypothetical protein NBV67_13895 [Tagaea sp.]|nr:hypothetical protein [Tagaea sp.]